MAKLKPLQPIDKVAEEKKKVAGNQSPATPTMQMTGSLLQKINGELCFNLQFGDKNLLISESKCSQLIPEFKKMNAEQKETFLMQAAIFGANPFTVPAEIYPVKYKSQDGTETYAPVISEKKYTEKGMENQRFDGCRSGVTVETKDGLIIDRKGQVYSSNETLVGGWCEVFIKGIREPIYRGVKIAEFEQRKSDGTLTRFWSEKGGKRSLMIEKVAKKQAFEIAMKLPKTYIEEELPIIEDVAHEDLTRQKALQSNVDFFAEKE